MHEDTTLTVFSVQNLKSLPIDLAVGPFSRADSIKNHVKFDSQLASNKPKTYVQKKIKLSSNLFANDKIVRIHIR